MDLVSYVVLYVTSGLLLLMDIVAIHRLRRVLKTAAGHPGVAIRRYELLIFFLSINVFIDLMTILNVILTPINGGLACWIREFFETIYFVTLTYVYFLRTFLWNAMFRRSKATNELLEGDLPDDQKKRLQLLRKMNSRSSTGKCISIVVLFHCLIYVVTWTVDPNYATGFSRDSDNADTTCHDHPVYLYTNSATTLVMAATFLLAYKTKINNDIYHVRREFLVLSGLVLVLIVISFIVNEYLVLSEIATLALLSCFYVGGNIVLYWVIIYLPYRNLTDMGALPSAGTSSRRSTVLNSPQAILRTKSLTSMRDSVRITKKQEFLNLISQPKGIESFMQFAQDEFSEENVLCWRLIQEYKELHEDGEQKEATHVAVRLYDSFIVEEAPLQVNIPYHVRESILMMFKCLQLKQLKDQGSLQTYKALYTRR